MVAYHEKLSECLSQEIHHRLSARLPAVPDFRILAPHDEHPASPVTSTEDYGSKIRTGQVITTRYLQRSVQCEKHHQTRQTKAVCRDLHEMADCGRLEENHVAAG